MIQLQQNGPPGSYLEADDDDGICFHNKIVNLNLQLKFFLLHRKEYLFNQYSYHYSHILMNREYHKRMVLS
jgi:hypothetical protein